MGQRHQVYVRLPAVQYGEGNPNNRPPLVIGLHHQWLYGRTAIRLLANFLHYHQALFADKEPDARIYSPLNDAGDGEEARALLSAVYSTDVAEGYFHRVWPFQKSDGELTNPYMGDNNDGITVIDLVDFAKPQYCFYTLDGIECADPRPKPHTILTARQYVGRYYPKFKGRKGEDLTAWIEPELEVIEKFPLMDRAALAGIFPKMERRKAAA